MTTARIGRTIAILLAAAGADRGAAADAEVDMYSGAFLPSTVTIDPGDSVTWIWMKGTHTVTSGLPGGAPGTPDEPGKLFDVPLDEAHPSFRYAFPGPGPGGVSFFCRQHPDQEGFVEISSGEITVRIAVVDSLFNPPEVTIFEGDSVSWEHEPGEGFHTVTSGLSSSPADSPGALFDQESSDAQPVFVYRFAAPGDYPFFCRPHEMMGMKGVVHVQKMFLRGDATGDGKLDISDAVDILGSLFLGSGLSACPDSQDSNADRRLDLTDAVYLLGFLFLGGSPPPPPFPRPGPDRGDAHLPCRA